MPSPVIFETPPVSSLRVSVVIPVRDEAALLPHSLTALATQTNLDGAALNPILYEILVLANNCRDETPAIARRFARDHPGLAVHVAERVLPADWANVGTARRLLMDEACRRLLSLKRPGGVIASTDGDTVVAPDWIAQTLQECSVGADAVGGRILVAGHRDAGARHYYLCDATYHQLVSRLEAILDPDSADPWPRHHQFFGGSLAVTAAAYCSAGGMPAVPELEDVALGRALQRRDARLRHSPIVRVTTSARQCGRAAQGLASQLSEWSDMAHHQSRHMVQDPIALASRFRNRACLRRFWRDARGGRPPADGAITSLAEALSVPVAILADGLRRPCDPFGMLWDQVIQAHDAPEGLWAKRWPLRPVTEAITGLQVCLSARTRPSDIFLPACR